MALTSTEKLTEAFSLALEDRASGYVDLVSNANALLATMRDKGMFKTFSGPTIRERLLYNESNTYIRYSGFSYLNPKPAELFNDAEFTPKMAAVSVTIANEDILKNSGPNQLKNLFEEHLKAAETELEDRFTEDLHSDGTADGGLQIGGLQLAIPTVANTGVYGGIDRAANAIWRTTTYDANSYFSTIGTQVSAATVKPMWDVVMVERSRGKKGPDLILASQQHYLAYTSALQAIQRINDETKLGKMGFTALKYFGAGKSCDVVLEGGIGSAMPANTTYFVDTAALTFRYHPDRNFSKIGGKHQPANQDAIVQHVGFMGELTMNNPLHTAKFYDSNPAA